MDTEKYKLLGYVELLDEIENSITKNYKYGVIIGKTDEKYSRISDKEKIVARNSAITKSLSSNSLDW